MDKKIPNPGSNEGIKQGCTCPVLDNEYGADWFGKVHGFFITGNCPLHDNNEYLKEATK